MYLTVHTLLYPSEPTAEPNTSFVAAAVLPTRCDGAARGIFFLNNIILIITNSKTKCCYGKVASMDAFWLY